MTRSDRSRSRPRLALLLPALATLLFLPACMSIAGRDHEIVLIETEPAGAEAVSVEGERCTTPCELRLPKMTIQAVWLEKAGFHPLEAALTGERWRTGIAASLAGNLALGAALAAAGVALIYNGELEGGIALAGGGVAIALGGGAMTDTESGAHLKLTPNPLRVVLVPEARTTEPSEDGPGAGAAPNR